MKKNFKEKLEEYNKKIKSMDLEKDSFIELNEKKFKPAGKRYIIRLIRNSLAHFETIHFYSYNERKLLLNSKKGIVICSIDDLFNFIANDVFHNEMRNTYDKTTSANLIPIEKNEKQRIRL